MRDVAAWAKANGFGGFMTFGQHDEYVSSQTGDARYPLSTALYNAVFGPPSPSVSSLPAMLPLYIGAALLLVFALLASRERARDTSPLKRESSIP